MATVRDIAQRAGVSTATVSRVLNNSLAVNESTRYAVLKAAQELNYPLENLRSRPQIGQSVLVLTRDDEHDQPTGRAGMREFERTVWGGVHSIFEKRGLATRLQHTHFNSEEASQYANDPSVSGLILLGGMMNNAFIEELLACGLPFVIAGSHLRPAQVNAVMAEVGDGVRQATRYLLDAGRRHVCFVNGPATTNTSAEKLDAFRLTLQEYGLPFDPTCVVASSFTAEEGHAQTSRLLAEQPDTDAILYAEDTIALGGLRALRTIGRRVPQDVAVIGFGDYDIAHYTEPPLTTVHFDMRLMGRIAARRLIMLLEEVDADTWLVRVPCTLVRRGSA